MEELLRGVGVMVIATDTAGCPASSDTTSPPPFDRSMPGIAQNLATMPGRLIVLLFMNRRPGRCLARDWRMPDAMHAYWRLDGRRNCAPLISRSLCFINEALQKLQRRDSRARCSLASLHFTVNDDH